MDALMLNDEGRRLRDRAREMVKSEVEPEYLRRDMKYLYGLMGARGGGTGRVVFRA